MSKKLPFEEALDNKLQQLPTPGEEASWQAMSKLLDENNKRIAPAPVKRYLLLLLLALLLGGGWWWFLANVKGTIRDAGQTNSRTSTSKETSADALEQAVAASASDETANGNVKTNGAKTSPAAAVISSSSINTATAGEQTAKRSNTTAAASESRNDAFNNHQKLTAGQYHLSTNAPGISEAGSIDATDNKPHNAKRNPTGRNRKGKATIQVRSEVQGIELAVDSVAAIQETQPNNVTPQDQTRIAEPQMALIANAAGTTENPVIASISAKDSAAVAVAKNSSARNPSTKHNKQHRLLWSAGIGLQQQIPLEKQQLVAYGFNGNKNIVNDYIPSIYLQLERDKKWFVQAAFSYGTPALIAPFAYSRKTVLNNTSTKASTVILQLKKTFNHQIPISFNYYLKPHWSVGTGVRYSLLHKAITEQQTITKNLQTHQEEITAQITSTGFTDSFFYKSQVGWLLQTNYEWRRFSFGLRYARDVQPFIRYTTPEGAVTEQTNWSLDCLLRYRIWRSGKKH